MVVAAFQLTIRQDDLTGVIVRLAVIQCDLPAQRNGTKHAVILYLIPEAEVAIQQLLLRIEFVDFSLVGF